MKKLFVVLFVFFSNTILAQDFVVGHTKYNNFTSFESGLVDKKYDNFTFGIVQEDTTGEKINPRKARPFGINLNLGGPSVLISGSFDFFVIPTVNLEVGTGFIGTFGGVKYHFLGNEAERHWTPFAGVYYTKIDVPYFFSPGGHEEEGLYFPVGIQYLGDRGFLFAVEVAGLLINNSNMAIFGGLKIGYHF